jgi:anaerobic magnesium-protoporphyrin IX monomethyl ester cyclase
MKRRIEVVFVNPNPGGAGLNEATVLAPLGLGYLAAALEQGGFSCSIIDAHCLDLSPEAVLKRIPPGTSLVGVTVNSFTYNASLRIAKLVKARDPRTAVILGGPVPTAIPGQVLDEFDCDGIIRGEGEYALLQVMSNLASGAPLFDEKIPGAAYRDEKGGPPVINPTERIKDLDRLPFPALNLLPPLRKYRSRARKGPSAPIVTSRGCQYDCAFCSKDVFGRRVTFRSAENVLEEIELLVDKYHVGQIDIVDDNFAANRRRLEQILDGVIKRYGDSLDINIQSGVRTETLDEPLLRKMKQAGISKIAFGIESADEEVLKLSRKHSDLNKIAESAQLARRLGFTVFGFFIIGLPGETEEAFRKTLDYAHRIKLDVANFCMAIPFVGTELFSMVSENGRFLIDTTRNIDTGFYGGQVFYEYDEITEAVVRGRYRRAYKEFYTLRKKLDLLLGIRSFREARWLMSAGMSVVKGMLKSSWRRLLPGRSAHRRLDDSKSLM